MKKILYPYSMSFAVHTFETNPSDAGNTSFSFHETLGEGQEIYFLAQFNPKSKDAQKAAEVIFGALIDQFEQSNIQDSYDRFEESLRVVNLESRKHKNLFEGVPNIVIAYFDFHNLYLTQSGGSEAYLIRGGNVSQISEFIDTGEDLFLNILSGQVTVEDTVIMASTRLLRVMTASQLSDVFSRSDFADSVSIFRHELTTLSEEDIVVTAIGIGKKDSTQGAGFLNKVVAKGKKALGADAPKKKKKEEVLEELEPIEEELPLEVTEEIQHVQDVEDIIDEPEDAIEEPPIYEGSEKKSLMTLLPGLPKFKADRSLIIVAVSVLAVLILGLGFRAILGHKSEEVMLLENKLATARTAIQQANAFLIQGEKAAARDNITTASESVSVVLNSENKELRNQAQFTMAQIQELQDQIENVTKLTPDALANIGVKNNTFDAQGLLDLKGNLFAYGNKVVHKTVRNIVEKEVAISEKETILAGAARPDQNTLVFLTDGPRLIEYQDGIITPMATEDDAWKRGIDIQNFSSRFTYILDPVENQIWKYTRQRSSYSSGSPYNEGADLSQAVSFVIDGSIYILSEDGMIQKLFRGAKVDYEFRNLPELPFRGKGLKIFTREELSFLYVLDPANARILIFEKGERFATYKRQVQFNLGKEKAVDFVIDAAGQKASLLTETQIYEVNL